MNLKIEHLYIAYAASELLSVVSNSGLFIYFVFDLLFHLTLSFPVKLYSFLPFFIHSEYNLLLWIPATSAR
jgi:hypothetical protein